MDDEVTLVIGADGGGQLGGGPDLEPGLTQLRGLIGLQRNGFQSDGLTSEGPGVGRSAVADRRSVASDGEARVNPGQRGVGQGEGRRARPPDGVLPRRQWKHPSVVGAGQHIEAQQCQRGSGAVVDASGARRTRRIGQDGMVEQRRTPERGAVRQGRAADPDAGGQSKGFAQVGEGRSSRCFDSDPQRMRAPVHAQFQQHQTPPPLSWVA